MKEKHFFVVHSYIDDEAKKELSHSTRETRSSQKKRNRA